MVNKNRHIYDCAALRRPPQSTCALRRNGEPDAALYRQNSDFANYLDNNFGEIGCFALRAAERQLQGSALLSIQASLRSEELCQDNFKVFVHVVVHSHFYFPLILPHL